MFLHNAWYAAAWDREVARTPLGRTFLDHPVVLYRKRDGTPVALEDRCCHRHVPLSLGVVLDDDIRCGYHGLRFGPSGDCVEVPGQDTVPRDARVRSYPVVERWHWLWIWMGDPARADPGLIPSWWWMDHPEWTSTRPDVFHVKCNYQLINDNVLDVTHLVYVHANTIGASSIAEFPVQTERAGDTVRMTRWIIDRPAPPLYQQAGQFAGNVDRWQIVEHTPPAYSVNFAGCAPTGTGAPQGHRKHGIELMALSAPTPETANSTHYFFAFVRGFKHADPAIERIFSVDFVNVFREDVVILEAQQRMMQALPGAAQVDIKVDAAPLAARRLLAQRIDAERNLATGAR